MGFSGNIGVVSLFWNQNYATICVSFTPFHSKNTGIRPTNRGWNTIVTDLLPKRNNSDPKAIIIIDFQILTEENSRRDTMRRQIQLLHARNDEDAVDLIW